jgi:hypothetical protein
MASRFPRLCERNGGESDINSSDSLPFLRSATRRAGQRNAQLTRLSIRRTLDAQRFRRVGHTPAVMLQYLAEM